MTHQPNKQFNTYKEGLNLKVQRRYCMEYWKVKTMNIRGAGMEVAVVGYREHESY